MFKADRIISSCRIRRYVMVTLGGLALAFGIIRIWVFKIPESPKYLISKGRDAEAVEAVNYIARYNGKPEILTIEMLQEIDRLNGTNEGLAETSGNNQAITTSSPIVPSRGKLSYRDIIKESFKDYQARNYRSLFSGRKMAQHSAVTFIIWLTIGIAYPLFFAFITSYIEAHSNYSADTSLNHTYMVYCIVSAVGVIGPITAGFAVESRFGRRYMMAGSAVLTGVFLFAYTTVKSGAANIGFQCATAILGNFGMLFFDRTLALKS